MNKNVILAIIITALVVSGAWFLVSNNNNNGEPNDQDLGNQNQSRVKVETDNVRVEYPFVDAVVESPLVAVGEARGSWFFEANFSLRLLDANGNVLAQGYAQTPGEWMTTDFVPFESIPLNFSTPSTDTGTLVLEKANPSGLPENAAEVSIPVRFR